MNSAVVLFFAFVAVVSAAGIKDDSIEITQSCATEFSIADDVIASLITKPSEAPVTDNVKCFSKCVSDKTKVVSKDNVIDVEKMVFLWKSHGHDEAVFRNNFEKCKTLFKFEDSCEGNWATFKCINGF